MVFSYLRLKRGKKERKEGQRWGCFDEKKIYLSSSSSEVSCSCPRRRRPGPLPLRLLRSEGLSAVAGGTVVAVLF